MSAPPVRVEQIIDGSTFSVQVTLDPALIIDALARDLRRYTGNLALIRHLPADHPEHLHARAQLVALLADTFTVVLAPEQAETFACDLDPALDEPDRCARCDRYGVVTVEGDPLCDGHARALDAAQVTG